MALTWGDIVTWNPAGLDSAQAELSATRARLVGHEEDADSALSTFMGGDSSGEAVESLKSAVEAANGDFEQLIDEVSELIMATAEASEGVSEVQTLIGECTSYAGTYDYLTISSAGAVHLEEKVATTMESAAPNGPIKTELENGERREKKTELEGLIEAAIAKAEEVDASYKARLDAVENGTYAYAEESDQSPGMRDTPDPSWSDTEVAAWWNSLTPEERQQAIESHPRVIGNTDGIDAQSRDKANRIYMETAQQRLHEAADGVQKKYDEWAAKHPVREAMGLNPYEDELRIAKDKAADIDEVVKQANAHPDYSLLVLDTSGTDHVRTAMAIGDVDSADHVATFVPGMGTDPKESLSDYLAQGNRLQREARDNRNGSVSTVIWMGYDAPADAGEPGWTEVASTRRADAGATRLADFTEGIQASRSVHHPTGASTYVSDPHQTILGHSYGSTTAGMAVARVDDGVVDDLIMFGSPGSGVTSIDEYNLDSGTAYVSAVDSDDAVQGSGSLVNSAFGTDPKMLMGITHLSGETPDQGGWLWNPLGRHSSYMMEGSQALADFADVMTGSR